MKYFDVEFQISESGVYRIEAETAEEAKQKVTALNDEGEIEGKYIGFDVYDIHQVTKTGFRVPSRKCTKCNKQMHEGYCINGGEEYYCSDKCLRTEISPKEWEELYRNGEGDSYWTEWED